MELIKESLINLCDFLLYWTEYIFEYKKGENHDWY